MWRRRRTNYHKKRRQHFNTRLGNYWVCKACVQKKQILHCRKRRKTLRKQFRKTSFVPTRETLKRSIEGKKKKSQWYIWRASIAVVERPVNPLSNRLFFFTRSGQLFQALPISQTLSRSSVLARIPSTWVFIQRERIRGRKARSEFCRPLWRAAGLLIIKRSCIQCLPKKVTWVKGSNEPREITGTHFFAQCFCHRSATTQRGSRAVTIFRRWIEGKKCVLF